MKKLNWTKKPVTWGGYLKLCGIGVISSILISLMLMGYNYIDLIEPSWYTRIKEFCRR